MDECKAAVICSSYPGAGASWIATVVQKILRGWEDKDITVDESKLGETNANEEHTKCDGGPATAPQHCRGTLVACSHLPCDKLPENTKIIYVYRDPRDAAVSCWDQTLASDVGSVHASWTEFLAFFLNHGGKSGLWSDHFWSCQEAQKRRGNILPLYYECVVEDMEGTIKQVASFLGKQLDLEATSKLVRLCTPAAPFSNRDMQMSSSRDWKTVLTVAQCDLFDSVLHSERKRLKLDMPYWPYSKINIDAPPFPDLYEYQGVPFLSISVPYARLRSVYNYSDIREDDVFVWTYPKAGTHWVKEIVNCLPSKPDLERTRDFDLDLVMLEVTPPSPPGETSMVPQSLEELSEYRSPRIIGTHLPFRMLPRLVQQGKAKVIYVYRDPRDMAVSGYHMLKAVNSHQPLFKWSVLLERYMEGKVPFGSWWEHFYSCQQNRHRPNVLVLYYEEMKQDPREAVRKIAGFLSKTLSEADIDAIVKSCSIEEAKKAKPHSVFLRKGVSGDWKNHFTVLENECIQKQLQEMKDAYSLDIPY